MLKKVGAAMFVTEGLFGGKRRFVSGNLRATNAISKAQYEALVAGQALHPVCLLADSAQSKRWWMFRDVVYRDDDGLSSVEVEALILDRENKKRQKVDRAVAAMQGTRQQAARRERIPDDVQSIVWNRDGGRCVKCGGQERLEFDHIIPLSRGGSNTARNLQLLCETCNRSKGAQIG